jgi:hypothetical protein
MQEEKFIVGSFGQIIVESMEIAGTVVHVFY